jgi:dTDP-4-amino-4,6-dideoxy-D-galactose acyltransferase
MDTLINRLEWDSNFFGYEVGKLELAGVLDYESFERIIHHSRAYRLLYIFSNSDLIKVISKFSSDKLLHVDTKITYALKLNKQSQSKLQVEVRCYKFSLIEVESESLMKLTYQSGKYSRFSKDKNFVQDEFHKLFAQWIRNSLNGKSTVRVYGYNAGDNLIAFVVIDFSESIATINLIAVDENYQGKGIGKMLMFEVFGLCFANRVNYITVVTQFENEKACNFYKSCGMEAISKQYIYHLWQ